MDCDKQASAHPNGLLMVDQESRVSKGDEGARRQASIPTSRLVKTNLLVDERIGDLAPTEAALTAIFGQVLKSR